MSWVPVASKLEGVCPTDNIPLSVIGRQAVCWTCHQVFKRSKKQHEQRHSTERDVTQEEMDHKDVGMSSRYVQHMSPEKQKQLLNQMDKEYDPSNPNQGSY